MRFESSTIGQLRLDFLNVRAHIRLRKRRETKEQIACKGHPSGSGGNDPGYEP
jgi:hypothetical protein